ncbi:hypothetical protein [Halorussus halophilus]|uniref:hypothetical protein n=1 Tax=Halorussus halophilus TaxID=2650975 RepID=UPI001300F69D|nr:hypothetical protein [Halorussus halophilus]
MDRRAVLIATAVQASLAVVVLRGTLDVSLWVVVPVGGVLVGAISRGFQSELAEGFLVGTAATVLTVLAYFFAFGGWADATLLLRQMGIAFGYQLYVVLFAVFSTPLVGLANAATALVGSSLRRRVVARRERAES